MTLDVYADLVDDDLARTGGGKRRANADLRHLK